MLLHTELPDIQNGQALLVCSKAPAHSAKCVDMSHSCRELAKAPGFCFTQMTRKMVEILNWDFVIKVLPLYREALWLTLRLGLCGTALATAVGLLCAAIQYEKVPVLRQIVAGYIELSRNTPLLIQLFFIYYGLPKIGIKTDPAVCGVVGLAFLGGSYMAEAFRSGLEDIEPIQQESALSLGLTRGQNMRYVILPQAMSMRTLTALYRLLFLEGNLQFQKPLRLKF